MRTIIFILVIAAFVQLVEMIIRKYQPSLYKALGIYLPLITTNCAVLGVTLVNLEERYSLIESVVNSFSAGIGFTFALLLMSGIRERLELADVPKSFRNLPIAFITAALLGLAFMAFSGMRL
jgi:electron transport complex protein RnfA